jgi:hypothetical protein
MTIIEVERLACLRNLMRSSDICRLTMEVEALQILICLILLMIEDNPSKDPRATAQTSAHQKFFTPACKFSPFSLSKSQLPLPFFRSLLLIYNHCYPIKILKPRMTFKKFSAAAAYTRPSETWYKNYIKFRIFASEKGRICGLYPEAECCLLSRLSRSHGDAYGEDESVIGQRSSNHSS